MQLLIDASAIREKVTGAGQCATALLLALSRIDGSNKYTILLDRSIGKDHPVYGVLSNKNFSFKLFHIPAIGPKRQWVFWRQIRSKITFDVFHCLMSNYPLAINRNGVVTIHDLKYLFHPYFLGRHYIIKSFYLRMIISHAIRSCRQVIVVSESTKKDILRFFRPCSNLSKKIQVIHEAPCMPTVHCSEREFEQFRFKNNVMGRFFLYVGEQRPHKNIDGLIEAYKQFIRQNRTADICLVLVGIRHKSFKIIEEPRLSHNCPGIVHTGFVEDHLLNELYANAFALLYPSFYEGFGLPLVEAMKHGTPIITSNVSSMPEVTGGSALLINPYSSTSIKNAMDRIFNDSHLRNEMAVKGLNRVKAFSWDSAAEKTIAVYRSV